MKKLINWLGSGSGTFFTVLFALTNKIVLVLIGATIGRDEILQLHISENILAGRGVGIIKYYFNDPDTAVFENSLAFPPGYSFVIAPFLKLFNHNYYLATTVFDLTVAVLFIVILRWICKQIKFPLLMTNLITVIYGCFQYLFFLHSAPTDAISVLLILSCIAVFLKIISERKRLSAISLLAVTLLFFIPPFFRYMYISIPLLFPVALLYFGNRIRQPNLIRSGKLLTSLSAGLFIIFIFIFNKNTGNIVPQYSFEQGFFPGNILRWWPFIPASFINLDFAALRLDQFTPINYQQAFLLFEFFNIATVVALTAYFFIFRKDRKTLFTKNLSFGLFISIGLTACVTILMTIIYASLKHTSNVGPNIRWTFAYEYRYFGFLSVFIQLSFLGWLYFFQPQKKSGFARYLVYLTVFVLSIECLHGFYYNTKALFKFKETKSLINKDADYQNLIPIINNIKVQYPGYEILVTSSDRFFYHMAILSGYRGLFDVNSLNKSLVKVKKKSILLVAIPYNHKWILEKHLTNFPGKLIATFEGTDFYYHEIYP